MLFGIMFNWHEIEQEWNEWKQKSKLKSKFGTFVSLWIQLRIRIYNHFTNDIARFLAQLCVIESMPWHFPLTITQAFAVHVACDFWKIASSTFTPMRVALILCSAKFHAFSTNLQSIFLLRVTSYSFFQNSDAAFEFVLLRSAVKRFVIHFFLLYFFLGFFSFDFVLNLTSIREKSKLTLNFAPN